MVARLPALFLLLLIFATTLVRAELRPFANRRSLEGY